MESPGPEDPPNRKEGREGERKRGREEERKKGEMGGGRKEDSPFKKHSMFLLCLFSFLNLSFDEINRGNIESLWKGLELRSFFSSLIGP